MTPLRLEATRYQSTRAYGSETESEHVRTSASARRKSAGAGSPVELRVTIPRDAFPGQLAVIQFSAAGELGVRARLFVFYAFPPLFYRIITVSLSLIVDSIDFTAGTWTSFI